MAKMTPTKLDKNLGPVLWGTVVGLQGILGAAYLGWLGLNLGLGEAILYILGAAILLNESLIENAKDLGKMKILPIITLAAGVSAGVYGVGLLTESISIIGAVSPYKIPLIGFILLMEIMEAYTKK